MKKNTIPSFRDIHNTHFTIGYHVNTRDPEDCGRRIFEWYGGTTLDAINHLLQEEKDTPAWCIVLDDFVEDMDNPHNIHCPRWR